MPLTRPVVVAAPAGPATPYGLLSVAVVPPVVEQPRWGDSGVTWRPAQCTPPQAVTGGCVDLPDGASPVDPDFSVPSYDGPVLAYPFTLVGYDACEPVGSTLAEAAERAERQVMLGESTAIERVIETGLGGTVEPSFATATDLTPTPGTAVTVAEGIALLESALGWYAANGYGVLHLSRAAATVADAQGISFAASGGRLTTALGTPVAAGGGYTGRAAIGGSAPAAGTQWLYATGMPTVWRSPVVGRADDVGVALDRATNDRLVVADRDVVVGWTCGTWAVLVDGVPDTSGVLP